MSEEKLAMKLLQGGSPLKGLESKVAYYQGTLPQLDTLLLSSLYHVILPDGAMIFALHPEKNPQNWSRNHISPMMRPSNYFLEGKRELEPLPAPDPAHSQSSEPVPSEQYSRILDERLTALREAILSPYKPHLVHKP